MDVNEIKDSLTSGTTTEKLEILSFLSDVFESYNKNIAHFEQIMSLLIDSSVHERNLEVKEEIFEVLVKAAVYQNIHQIDFDKLANNLDKLPIECLSRCVDILGFSHNMRYLSSIKRYSSHDDINVRESVELAVKELLGYK